MDNQSKHCSAHRKLNGALKLSNDTGMPADIVYDALRDIIKENTQVNKDNQDDTV